MTFREREEVQMPKMRIDAALKGLTAMATISKSVVDGRHDIYVRPHKEHEESMERTLHQMATLLTGMGRFVSVHDPKRAKISTFFNGKLKTENKMQNRPKDRNLWTLVIHPSERPDCLDELLEKIGRGK